MTKGSKSGGEEEGEGEFAIGEKIGKYEGCGKVYLSGNNVNVVWVVR